MVRDEPRVLKSIVYRLLERKVVIHPPGLEEIVREFERTTLGFVKSDDKVQIVGIVGPGGSGKTTLVKELYTRKCPIMKRSSFLPRVGATAAEKALINLQKKLVLDLLPDSLIKDLPFRSIDDGKIIVASRLRSVRVLLVLEDVDHVDQLDALLPRTENLSCGSLIIVTTRHLNLLTSWGISSIYEMKGLYPLQAEQLLCRHAFPSSSPPHGFECSVKMFIRLCERLPLTLKVLGELLQGKNEEYWELCYELNDFYSTLNVNDRSVIPLINKKESMNSGIFS